MIPSDEYIFFPEGTAKIGIDPASIDGIFNSLKSSDIKKDYISASTPEKIIHYNQFYIGKKLVNVECFRRFIQETKYITEAERDGWGWIWNGKWIKKQNVSWEKPFLNEMDNFYNLNSDVFPVMQASWNDAVEYTKWISNFEGLKIRLPYEYEWEIFGNYAGLNSLTGVINNSAEKNETDTEFTLLLKNKLSSSEFQLGLLWEWTLDWYKGYDQSIINKDFGNIYKILRGGSLLSESIQKTREFRFRRCPTARSPYYGFRVVVE